MIKESLSLMWVDLKLGLAEWQKYKRAPNKGTLYWLLQSIRHLLVLKKSKCWHCPENLTDL